MTQCLIGVELEGYTEKMPFILDHWCSLPAAEERRLRGVGEVKLVER